MQSIDGSSSHLGEELQLLQANAVFAGDRAAEADAKADDFGGEDLGAIVCARFAAVIQNQWMQVPVTSMEDVGDANAMLTRDTSISASASPRRARGTTPS